MNNDENREILKAKFRAQGLELRDDNSLYRGDEVVATDVKVVDLGVDALTFELDIPAENVAALEDESMTFKPITVH